MLLVIVDFKPLRARRSTRPLPMRHRPPPQSCPFPAVSVAGGDNVVCEWRAPVHSRYLATTASPPLPVARPTYRAVLGSHRTRYSGPTLPDKAGDPPPGVSGRAACQGMASKW